MSKPEPDEDGYFRYIADADAREIANAETYDKSLLTLSSALLGVSLTFTQNAVPFSSARYIWCLLSAWVLFSLTIILVIGSIMYGQSCFKRLKDNARTYYLEGNRSANKLSERISDSIRRFNIITGVCFILGVAMFTTFVGINVYRGNVMTKETTIKIERSQVPSTYQQQQGNKPAAQEQTNKPQATSNSEAKK